MNKQEAVKDIVGKAIEISQNSEADMFVDYASHVGTVGVNFYEAGWTEDKYADWWAYVHLEENPTDSIMDYKNNKTSPISLEELLTLVSRVHGKIMATKKEIYAEIDAAFQAHDIEKAMTLVTEKTQEFSDKFVSEISPYAEVDTPFIIMSLELIANTFRTNDTDAALVADELKQMIGSRAMFFKN